MGYLTDEGQGDQGAGDGNQEAADATVGFRHRRAPRALQGEVLGRHDLENALLPFSAYLVRHRITPARNLCIDVVSWRSVTPRTILRDGIQPHSPTG
jgi:hypothetical protein